MKFLLSVVLGLVSLNQAFAAAPMSTPTTSGELPLSSYCQVIPPGQRDSSGRYCTASYGVLHGGYIVDNTCYYNPNDAYAAANNLYACSIPAPVYVGACHILYPSQRSEDGSFCNNSYGIYFRGRLLYGSCYSRMDESIRQMQNSPECNGGNQSYQYCSIVPPGSRDRAGRYCNGAYGFEYDGYIVNNTCYYNPNDAYAAMGRELACNYRPPYYFGRCNIFNPGVRDQSGAYCNNTYGIGYNGRIINRNCYYTLSDTIRAMQNSGLCQ